MTEGKDPDFALRFEQRDDYLYAFITGQKDKLNVY